jgi:hypothetical protein
MRAAARMSAISASRSAALMRSGDKGFGAEWASRKILEALWKQEGA